MDTSKCYRGKVPLHFDVLTEIIHNCCMVARDVSDFMFRIFTVMLPVSRCIAFPFVGSNAISGKWQIVANDSCALHAHNSSRRTASIVFFYPVPKFSFHPIRFFNFTILIQWMCVPSDGSDDDLLTHHKLIFTFLPFLVSYTVLVGVR